MPTFQVYIDIDVSVTTESVNFLIEAEDRDAARALVEACMKDSAEKLGEAVYPEGTVEGGTPGAAMDWTISSNDPCTRADIEITEL